MYVDGGCREMTPEEELLYGVEDEVIDSTQTNPLTEMVTAMSTATTIAQMRTAAKSFLDKTNI